MTNEFWELSVDPPKDLPLRGLPRNLKQMEEVTLTAQYDPDSYQMVLTAKRVRELIEQGVIRFSTEDDMKAALKAMEGHSEEVEITFVTPLGAE